MLIYCCVTKSGVKLFDSDQQVKDVCFQLLGGQKATGGFWTFEYYQSFFNVDTMQVRDTRPLHTAVATI